MTNLLTQIERAFGSPALPSREELVRPDGFDALGKAFLVTHLLGKTQQDVLQLLRDGALGNGSTYTEELEVAEPAGIRYYLKPFLVHLAERIAAEPRALDDETPFFLFAHIRAIVEHRGRRTFTELQLAAIVALVAECERALTFLSDGLWADDVGKELGRLREALERA